EEVLLTEDVAKIGGSLLGLFVLSQADAGLDLATGASGGRDEAVAVLGEQLAVHPRLEVVALDGGARRQPEQVVHACGGLRQQGHVGVGTGARDVVSSPVAPPNPGLVATVG